jgi:peptidoglycan-N-acetylglucosamine deacetylase
VPSHLELLAMLERWRRFPALERAAAGAPATLTFDDGPDPAATPALLDALDAAGVKATFFLVGEQLHDAPRLAREVTDRGHEVGVHCFRHVSQDELSDREARDDMARALGAVEVATGRRPRWCRPPYGVFSEAGYAACRDLGLEPVYWSAAGSDWEPIPAGRIADLVCRDLAGGVVVLLHDSPRYAYRDSAQATAEAIPTIVAHARAHDIALGTLGEAAGAGR